MEKEKRAVLVELANEAFSQLYSEISQTVGLAPEDTNWFACCFMEEAEETYIKHLENMLEGLSKK